MRIKEDLFSRLRRFVPLQMQQWRRVFLLLAVLGALVDFAGVCWRLSRRNEVPPPLLPGDPPERRIFPARPPACLVFAPKGHRLFIGGHGSRFIKRGSGGFMHYDGQITAWDATTGARLWSRPWLEHPVWSLSTTPDGEAVLGLGRDGFLLRNATDGREREETLLGLALTRLPVVFNRDAAFLAGGAELAVSSRPMAGGDEYRRRGLFVYRYHEKGSGAYDVSLRLLPAAVSGSRYPIAYEEHRFGYEAHSVAASPDGRYLAAVFPVAHSDKDVYYGTGPLALRGAVVNVWEAATGRLRWTAPLLSPDETVRFSPDGRCVVCAGFGDDYFGSIADGISEIVAFSTAQGQEKWRLRLDKTPLYGLAFSPDGRRIATTDSLGGASLWEAGTGSLIRRYRDAADQSREASVYRSSVAPHTPGVVAFSPDGSRVACVSRTHVTVWNMDAARLR